MAIATVRDGERHEAAVNTESIDRSSVSTDASGRSVRWSRKWLIPVGVGLMVSTVLIWVGIDPVLSDIEYDWLAAGAAAEGDAYAPMLDIAEAAEVDLNIVRAADGSADTVHPRTPGALLLLQPLRLVRFDHLVPFIAGVSAALVLAFVMLWRRESVPSTRETLMLVATVASAPVLMAFAFGSVAIVIAWLSLASWYLGSRGSRVIAPVLAAVAISLKVFPLVLVAAWWIGGKRRLALITVLVTAVMNCAGLLLPGVGLSSAVSALADGATDFIRIPTNGSVAGLLINVGVGAETAVLLSSLLLVGSLALASRRPKGTMASLAMLLVLVLLFQPVSWASYDVILLPFALYLASNSRINSVVSAVPLLVWLLTTIPWLADVTEVAHYTVIARLCLASLLAVSAVLPGSEQRYVGFARQLGSHLASRERKAATMA